jgi:hypothetical protein
MMKICIQGFARSLLLASAVFMANWCRADEPEQILFQHFKLKDDVVTLVQSTVRPGVLKSPVTSEKNGELYLELLGGNGSTLWSDVLDDPTVQRMEYEDPDHPGQLKTHWVQSTEAEFTVRVPFHKAAKQLRVQRLASPALKTDAIGQAKIMLGTFELPEQGMETPVMPPPSPGTISQILYNGPTNKRINIVLLAEGYLASQTNKFSTDATMVLNSILNTPPFNAYRRYFNGFKIFVASAEAGSDHPSRSVNKDTYFNSTYDSYGLTRLVTIPPNDHDGSYANGKGKVDTLLQSLLPEYDVAVIVVNDTEYGGSGGNPLVVSIDSSAAEVAVHELAHNYAGLGDEYDSAYPGYPDIEEPNTTRETNRTSIKWNSWIKNTTPIPTPETSQYTTVIGLFEGAHYHDTGWYRPKQSCKMNYLGVPFCEVCAEALIKSTYGLVRPIETNSPTDSVITLVDPQSLTLSIKRMQPTSLSLRVQWFTNDVAVAGATADAFTVGARALLSGNNLVRVQVSDPTASVRNDPQNVLKDSRTWTVEARLRPLLVAKQAPDSDGFALSVSGNIGDSYRLQAASDPTTADWVDLLSFTLVDTVTNLVDMASPLFPTRFYRVISP